ncbi:MAG TPA: ribonuclease R [Thermodesulfovibrionales bacterium]|nr:ribonuclease R [Thermodesulfovibrionales bacterium]
MIERDDILSFFKEKTRRPVNFKEMVSLLGLGHKEARSLKRNLRDLVRSGDIVLNRKGLYGPAEDMSLANGYFESHKEGYGFVILEKPGERDLFIPAWATMGAMNNDRVLVRIENWQRREGRIVRILERVHTRIAGRLEISKTGLYVKPKNRLMHFDLVIPVGDRGGAKNGDTVIAEIVTPPKDRKPPVGRVIKVLGKPEDPKAEVEAILDEFSLPRRFLQNVHDEAKLLYRLKPDEMPHAHRRKDLRALPTVTIDGERARDFDDAVSIKSAPHGYTLYVHIADVGFFIDWNSRIDLEARKRGTSVYFPDRVIPMLPKELSEDLCSLKPDEDRFAFTVEMDFDRNGGRLSSRFYPSVVYSDARMTYTSVKKILIDNDRHERGRYDHLLRYFELMAELCGILRNKRLSRGSLDFDLPEPEVLLDIQGQPEAILSAERNFAHMIIEEFMVAANEAVAEYLSGLETPSLYRVHEEPDTMKMEDIARVIKSVYKLRHPLKPRDFPEVLRAVKGRPEEEIIHYMILRSLKQARYSHINAGHFGLASKCYTHFTSPIRRYPDLVVHRILREVLQKKHLSDKRIQELRSILPDIAFTSSQRERSADDAERAVIAAMRAWFMRDKVGGEFEAKIVNITAYGMKVRLKDFFVEGFLHISQMTDDFYQFNERTLTLVGRHTKRIFAIGKELKVRIDRVDMEEREVIVDIAG